MAPKRLSDDEKKEIVDLYRQPEETTSTLANRYGVSSSTISRILKLNLSAEEYDTLVQQKRTSSGKPLTIDSNLELPGILDGVKAKAKPENPSKSASDAEPETPEDAPDAESDQETPSKTDSWTKPKLRGDRTSAPAMQASALPETSADQLDDEAEESSDAEDAMDDSSPSSRRRKRRSRSSSEVESNGHQPVKKRQLENSQPNQATASQVEDDDEGESEDDDDSFDSSSYSHYEEDDLDDDLEDDFSDDDDDDEDDDIAVPVQAQHHELIKVFPFSDIELPRTCYLVIDRFAELIAPPLKDFAELGKIPEEEMMAKTLPVFDNHRVAKRFANRRTQRIVKVPDGRILQKTMPYLSAKGITRLLIDGQVYDLTDSD